MSKDNKVNKFNEYFANIDPNLAKSVPATTNFDDILIEKNTSSMCLKLTNEEEIINTVHKLVNKTSTDCDDHDMKTLKKVVLGISKPLTFNFNLSFKMKVT